MQGLLGHRHLRRRPRRSTSRCPHHCTNSGRPTTHRILHRLASLVFCSVGGSDEGGVLGHRQPHFEELVVEPTPAAGGRLDEGLGPVNGPILREHGSTSLARRLRVGFALG